MSVRIQVMVFVGEDDFPGPIPASVFVYMNGYPVTPTRDQASALLCGADPHKVMFPPGQLNAVPVDMRELK